MTTGFESCGSREKIGADGMMEKGNDENLGQGMAVYV